MPSAGKQVNGAKRSLILRRSRSLAVTHSLPSPSKLFPEQEKALRAFISRKDLLINLPTGYGKSLVFQMAPVVHEELSKNNDSFTAKPIVIVISPLISLMEDQVNSLTELKIKAAAIGDDKAVNTKIENGEYSVVSMEKHVVFVHLQKEFDWNR